MTGQVTDWLPVVVMAVLEVAFYVSAFLPAFLTAEAIKAVRRRQLARLDRETSGAGPVAVGTPTR